MISSLIRYTFAKVYKCPKEAVQGIKDGSKLLVGGFGICGIPMNLINAVRQSGVKDLTAVSNNAGVGKDTPDTDWGLGVLLRTRQIKRMISSYVGENQVFQKLYLNGELQVELVPQGTLIEKIRAGGAGIPAFYTATGYKTWIHQGGFPIKYKLGGKVPQIQSQPKVHKTFNGQNFIQEESIVGDFALVKAYKADRSGNLVFNKSARNFNQDMATAAKCVIAEVQHLVQDGQIDPDQVHIPGAYVDRIFVSDPNNPFSEKKIEKLTVFKQNNDTNTAKGADLKNKIIKRAAKQVSNGMIINLGIGIPTLLPAFLSKDIKITLHSENGILGVGDYPRPENVDPDLINAGKETVTVNPGASFFSSSQSFAMVRGGHLDLTILGALQISQNGDIANWIIPGKMVRGMGGAMDLVACKSKVIVVMQHTAKNAHKLLEKCTLPLTAEGVVSMVITQKAVFENRNGRLILTQIAQGSTLQEVQSLTGFKIQAAQPLKYF